MIQFIIKRLLYGFVVLLGVVTLVFFIFNILPGDPARMMLGQRADSASVAAIQRDLGRDQPLRKQFFMYLNDLSPLSVHDVRNTESAIYLDKEKYTRYTILFSVASSRVLVVKFPYLRRSYLSKRYVSEILLDALPETLILAVAAMLFGSVLGIFLGIVAALRKHTWVDNLSLFLAALGMSAPSFFAGIIIAWIFGYLLSAYTGLNNTGSLYDLTIDGEVLQLKNLILPAVALGIRPLAIVVQLTRSSLLDVLSHDYIRTAKAKGLGFFKIVYKHALKNALNPVVTAISGWFASLMAGAFFIETVFDWKGIGYVTVNALEKFDFPVVMGSVLYVSVFFVIINIVVDILYGVLDPRIRTQ